MSVDWENLPSPDELAKSKQALAEVDEVEKQTLSQIREVLEQARMNVGRAVNFEMVSAYWEIGRQINDAIGERADYGKQLLKYLSKQLTEEFGKGFTLANLRNMRQFYQVFPIRYTLRSELSWSHYRLLMRVSNEERRLWYMNEAAESGWSVRQLERQINTSFYDRLRLTQGEDNKKEVAAEIQKTQPVTKADSFVRDPYILEFLGIPRGAKFSESQLEGALVDKLQQFLLELGRGFCFVGRQMRITDDKDEYYVDLVFYNYLTRCFVLIDLKTKKLTHQDVGQMDFYVRLFEDKYKPADDNPPIGIILCTEKSEATAKYSVLADKENLFASTYMTYLPTEEELAALLREGREEVEEEQWRKREAAGELPNGEGE
ncbi:PDDEXK nuclease domain-containing protein [Adlercreutzia sp. ZJ141]|uniref:PDDEXK nuclease domain-containing protein n=1 Tax=Adlercreutzia sp. ZJ141 TaxID=2709406 RepID=UPI0013EDE0C2|nr:PDDEXK nuclease domain-containing protein [Adlercreutzia sp. ZJ141]